MEAKVFKMALNGNDAVAANLCTWLLRCHWAVPYDPMNRTELAVASGIIFIPQKLSVASRKLSPRSRRKKDRTQPHLFWEEDHARRKG
jgi:hypothetical protein